MREDGPPPSKMQVIWESLTYCIVVESCLCPVMNVMVS